MISQEALAWINGSEALGELEEIRRQHAEKERTTQQRVTDALAQISTDQIVLYPRQSSLIHTGEIPTISIKE